MRKRRLYVLLIAALALIGVLFAVLSGPREPEYQGRKLSEWVERYTNGGWRLVSADVFEEEEPNNAIRHLGTNTIPHLLKWVGYEMPPWKRKFYRAVYAVFGKLTRSWHIKDENQRGDSSVFALIAL